MHPNPAFRSEDRALMETLIDEIGFGMVFAQTPDGPRVAHTPLLSTGDGAVQFHLARGNALSRHLPGMTALTVVNGPDSYVSPRWYDDAEQVPTWNYVALELEGPVRRMDTDGLMGLLESLSDRQEARVAGGTPWTMDKVPQDKLRQMAGAIVGFEMEVRGWRPTLKLSQNKDAADRARVADALEAQGALAVAQLMRTLAP
ncbi:FMN-binding negative transcriptional regulator [Novosphingobium sp. TH158]|uniref:FMN-binding negative transcriptional regulator n=1 Tax=Novosphingobium sp. TH158 TaxID=2067455 RepID=UPI000C7C71DB|nr:FMN-binding negative transcriptional regulator [Novosphingobium sp. TH158]PLK26487.1 negative transcriptional regulator [Novosphingobium sp. TH158]